MAFIEIRDLKFSYLDDDNNNKAVIDGINLDIEKGEFLAVLGRNGSGKSTLAKLLNMILETDDGQGSGTITVNGVRLSGSMSDDEVLKVRKSVGMVFQNPDNQLVATVVEEDIAFGPENLGVEPSEIRKRVDDALAAVGMSEYAKHSPARLSGGQKQRVAIAGVLAMMPECIIFDESTAMLDPAGRDEVMDTICSLNKKSGITVIHITHNMSEAVLADRVVVIDNGSIVMRGTPREVFSEVDRMSSLGLAVPQVSELCHRLRKKGIALPGGLLTEDEVLSAITKLLRQSANESAAGAQRTERTGKPLTDAGANTALKLDNVSYVYGAGTVFRMDAVDGVSAEIEAGRVTGIIGHTGSGKSTLVQMMNGLIKPSEGQVLLFGRDIFENRKTLREARFRVGLVFQYPEYQLFEETVYKDIAYGPRNMGLDQSEIDSRVREAARLVGLGRELFDSSPFELSGGQKRRVAIAGIMAMKPEVLVLDEPASGLDPVGRNDIFGAFRSYRDVTGGTVVIVSHSMEDMARYADSIIVMNHGKCFMQGSRDEVFSHAGELCSMGLDLPQITSLTNALRVSGAPIPTGIYTVDAAADALLPLLSR